MAVIDYWFAPHSPYAYLGHDKLREIAAKHRAAIRVLPVDLARVFAATGGLPLAQRPKPRQDYRLLELSRWSEFRVLPLHPQPKFFPVDALPAAKLIIAADASYGAERALDLAGAIMHAVWAAERDIADLATLVALADEVGLPGAMLAPASMTDTIATRLDANTQAALAAGAFGVPTYVIDGEPFWGQDRLEFVERALVRAG